MKIFAMVLLAVMANAVIGAEGEIINKVGDDCPTGTYATQGYCKSFPSSDNRYIGNPTGGRCPAGMYKSGNYCKHSSRTQSSHVINRPTGSESSNGATGCPTGYYKQGAYCSKRY